MTYAESIKEYLTDLKPDKQILDKMLKEVEIDPDYKGDRDKVVIIDQETGKRYCPRRIHLLLKLFTGIDFVVYLKENYKNLIENDEL